MTLSRITLAVALAGGFLITPSMLPDVAPLDGIRAAAEAADFTGRIKRVMIKKKRVGSGFKVVAVSDGDGADSVDSADITLTDANGAVLEVLTLNTAKRGRVRTSSENSGVQDGDNLTVTITASMIDSSGDPFGEQQEFEVSVDGLEARTAPTPEGWEVTASVNAAGTLKLIVTNDNSDWAGGGVTGVSYVVNDGTVPVVATIDEVRQRRVANLSTDFTGMSTVGVDAVLYNADGNAVDSIVQTAFVTDEPVTLDGPAKVKTVSKANGTGKVVVTTTDSVGDADSVSVTLTDSATGAVVIDETLTTPTKTVQVFHYADLEFEPGESPVDFIYLCLIDLIDSNGDPVGSQREVEALILGPDADAAANEASVGTDGIGPVGVMIYEQLNGKYGVYVEVHDPTLDIASANVIFEEPFEGPAPLELEVGADIYNTLRTWKVTSADDAPSAGVLTVTDANGTIGGMVEIPEILYRTEGNGSGTTKASSAIIRANGAIMIALL